MAESASYGGQAVIEGVMIRGAGAMAVACRRPNGRIAVRTQTLGAVSTGAARQMPFVRGVLALAETLCLGMRALTFSSNVSREPADAADEGVELPDTIFWGSIIIALGFMAALFFATPMLISHGLERLGVGAVISVAIEGAIRMAMFLGYIYLIGKIPGIRRVFQYHGAEHMAVHANEAGAPLTIESVRAYPKEHTRCGTSFLLVVMTVSVVTFFAFDLIADPSLILRIVSRVVFIPAIAAVSYELLRLGAQHRDKSFVRTLFLPNIALQALTTRVPDDTQIEVAITSLEAVIAHVRTMPALVPVADDAELRLAPAGD